MACVDDVSSFLNYEIDKYFVVSVTNHGKCENLYKWKMRYELQKSLNYILNKKKTYDSFMQFRHENDELAEMIDYLYGIQTFSDSLFYPNKLKGILVPVEKKNFL